MGSAQGRGYDERPQHRVKVAPFLMGKHPITRAHWAAMMDMHGNLWSGCATCGTRATRAHRLPVDAAEVAGETEVRVRLSTAASFAGSRSISQFRPCSSGGVLGPMTGQTRNETLWLLAATRRPIEGGAYLRSRSVSPKSPWLSVVPVGCRIERQLAERRQVELGRGEIAAYQPHLGVAVRRSEAYLNGIALRIVSAQADLQIGEPSFGDIVRPPVRSAYG